jgi:hypothetical protein
MVLSGGEYQQSNSIEIWYAVQVAAYFSDGIGLHVS